MKVLILHGSPRKKGNTIKITEKFIEGMESAGAEIELIDTTKLKIAPCTGCLHCEKEEGCIIKDDMQDIYSKIINSDIIVLSSPVYFASVSGQLKLVMDRCQNLYSRVFIHKKESEVKRLGFLIFTAGRKNEKMIESMELTARYFMFSCNARFMGSIHALNTDEEPVEDRKELLQSAFAAGYNAVKK